jgi:hypothetical protein
VNTNEPPDSINGVEFFEKLVGLEVLEKDYVP